MNSQHMSVEIERLEKEQKELREAFHQAEVEATSIEKAQREREVRILFSSHLLNIYERKLLTDWLIQHHVICLIVSFQH